MEDARGSGPPLTRRQRLFDVLLGLACTALVLPISLSGIEAVPANRPPGPTLVLLTLVAVSPIVVRRVFPMTVLVITLLAVLVMVVTRSAVALSTLGPLIASYTAVAYQSARRAHVATAVLVVGFAAGALLQPVDLSVEGAIVQTIVFVGGWLLANATRERRELFRAGLLRAQDEAARERDRADAERERARRTATEERLRISREVHDVVGHAISVVIVQAGVAEQLVDTRPDQARQAVAEIARTGRQSMAEIRHLLGVLREGDQDDEPPLPSATATLDDVPRLADSVRTAGLAVDLTIIGTRTAVPPGIDLAAYRVIQEALTNTLRHAHATTAQVSVSYRPTAVDLEIVDDGDAGQALPTHASVPHGADPDDSGHGLAGMRERVVVYGGEFAAGPSGAGGFRVHAHLPLPGPAASGAPETSAALSPSVDLR